MPELKVSVQVSIHGDIISVTLRQEEKEIVVSLDQAIQLIGQLRQALLEN
jgi:hypothetical protein